MKRIITIAIPFALVLAASALAARCIAGVKKVENHVSIQPISTFGWE